MRIGMCRCTLSFALNCADESPPKWQQAPKMSLHLSLCLALSKESIVSWHIDMLPELTIFRVPVSSSSGLKT